MRHRYIPIESVIAKVKRDYDIQEPEYVMLEWAGEALDHVAMPKSLENVVCIVEIRDSRGLLPKDMVYLLQVVRYLKPVKSNNICDLISDAQTVVEDTPTAVYNPCCEQQQEEHYDIRSCLYEFVMSGCTLPKRGNSFIAPVRKTTNNFFETHRCDGTQPCEYEYKLGNGVIYTSFDTGYILISYLRFYRDSDSVLLIPDDVSVKEAIVRYIIFKHAEKALYRYDKYTDYRVAASKVQKAQMDWHWYARQAKNKLMALELDDYQNLYEYSKQKVAIRDYYEYFSTLNRSNY